MERSITRMTTKLEVRCPGQTAIIAFLNNEVALYDGVPDDTEILITHTPPYGMMDLTSKKGHVGCRILAERLEALGFCKLHVFGYAYPYDHEHWLRLFL